MRLRTALAAAVGFVVGTVVVVAVTAGGDAPSDLDPSTDPGESGVDPVVTAAPSTAVGASQSGASALASETHGPETLLVWTSGGLPAGFAETVAGLDSIARVSVVSGDEIGLVAASSADGVELERWFDGWTVPLDVLAVDPGVHAAFEPAEREVYDLLEPGTGLLTETSAALRGADVGATLELTTAAVTVVGVVPDLAGAGAELIVHSADAEALGVARPRYLLVEFSGDREALQSEIGDHLAAVDGLRAIRFRTRPETTWFRHGDAVLPAAQVKSRFGEFATRDRAGRSVEVDEDWVERHIVTATIPILGEVRCHVEFVDPAPVGDGEPRR